MITLEDAREEIHAFADLVVDSLDGPLTDVNERVVPAAEDLTAPPDELRYTLSFRITAPFDEVSSAADTVAAAIEAEGWTIESGGPNDQLFRATRAPGFLGGMTGAPDRETVSVSMTSPVIPTPEGVVPNGGPPPFPAWVPPR